MTDNRLEPVDVTGRWVGFWYGWEKPGRYPIIAVLRQTGNMITGEWYDQIRERADHFDRIAEILETQMPNEVSRAFERVFRRFGTGTVRIRRLPDMSEIEGKITGSQVRFTKTYPGLESTWIAREAEVGTFRRDGHKVQYSGEFDRDRTRITGRWVITQWGLPGRGVVPKQGRGSFELYRKS
jgi:hypothetical protein